MHAWNDILGVGNPAAHKECPDPKNCPAANLKLYVKLCDLMT